MRNTTNCTAAQWKQPKNYTPTRVMRASRRLRLSFWSNESIRLKASNGAPIRLIREHWCPIDGGIDSLGLAKATKQHWRRYCKRRETVKTPLLKTHRKETRRFQTVEATPLTPRKVHFNLIFMMKSSPSTGPVMHSQWSSDCIHVTSIVP